MNLQIAVVCLGRYGSHKRSSRVFRVLKHPVIHFFQDCNVMPLDVQSMRWSGSGMSSLVPSKLKHAMVKRKRLGCDDLDLFEFRVEGIDQQVVVAFGHSGGEPE
jgi:hypothetical protein